MCTSLTAELFFVLDISVQDTSKRDGARDVCGQNFHFRVNEIVVFADELFSSHLSPPSYFPDHFLLPPKTKTFRFFRTYCGAFCPIFLPCCYAFLTKGVCVCRKRGRKWGKPDTPFIWRKLISPKARYAGSSSPAAGMMFCGRSMSNRPFHCPSSCKYIPFTSSALKRILFRLYIKSYTSPVFPEPRSEDWYVVQ
jgi:hypothetical protein